MTRRERQRIASAKWQRNNPEAYRATKRRCTLKRYGLTFADYGRMLSDQKGVCAICRDRPCDRLVIDHDHATGRIRGLLCRNCNRALGLFEDCVDRLRAAIAYLEYPE